MVNNSRENMIATLWLLTLTLITASECVYAAPPLVEYRRSDDNTPLGIQDDYVMAEERPKRFTLSINDSLNKLRGAIYLNQLRDKLRERERQINENQLLFDRIGKRGNERHLPLEREYYEPYQQHLDLGTLIKTLADANHQSYNVPDDTAFDENNGIETNLGIPLRNMHFNIDEDAQRDRFNDLNDEPAWLHEKQQRHFNQIQKQQRLNEQNILHQWDNKQINDRTQVPSPQAQSHQQQENQQQKQQRQPDNSQQPTKSFDNDEHFMLQTFDTK